jgi:hypothetical protein
MQPSINPASWAPIRVPADIELRGFGIPIEVDLGDAFPYDRANQPALRIDLPRRHLDRAARVLDENGVFLLP